MRALAAACFTLLLCVRLEAVMVVSSHALGSQAGVDVMKAGGNAVDAAIATGMALAVVHPSAGNIGGGGFMIVFTKSGEVTTFDFREKAPAAAHEKMFLDANGEFGLGIESAIISGPFHAAAEGFWQSVDRPGALTDPTFFGGYAEAGFFLPKGDSRGYKGGIFDRVKPKKEVGEGGFGAVQIVARYDYLDLNDGDILGGTQNGFGASLIWTPTDYTRFMLNYGRMDYDDAVYATASGDTSYAVDAFGVRAQVDF